MQSRGEKSGVNREAMHLLYICGCKRPLYQNYRRKPPRDSDIDTISGSFLLRFFRGCDAELKEMPAIIGDWKGINAGFRFYQSNIQFASRRTADRIGH